ncbi:hypothetical protein [Candidatus Uabimicrobium amorphum]|uniref:Uncharacterized protein n=1 Tax=Uabimicrobium amorphum TaxID=2596890 RepID=A0A5S9IPB4_UABAM|nr:hypothetical protein [Candidatus Uabimicrobium amorphum]BBM85136.1 hypothetical protein UABAM_03499 [Candidatus Uabimicrobium amorphum]
MKNKIFIMFALLSIFFTQSLLANPEFGEWGKAYIKAKKDYEKNAKKGDELPREKVLGFITKEGLTNKIKDLDEDYEKLKDPKLNFREVFKDFKKHLHIFCERKDDFEIFLKDDDIQRAKDPDTLKATKIFEEDLDEIEKSMRRFMRSVRNTDLEVKTIKFDLILCDKKTECLLEPSGEIEFEIKMADAAMKKYFKTIKARTHKELKTIRKALRDELIRIDNRLKKQIGEEPLDQKTIDEYTKEAQKEFRTSVNRCETVFGNVVDSLWIEIREAKVRYGKYKLQTAITIAKGVIGTTSAIARLVASGGTDISGYFQAAKSLKTLVETIYQAHKDCETVAAELNKKIEEYTKQHKAAEGKGTLTAFLSDVKTTKMEADIRTHTLRLMNKAAGVIDKASELGSEIAELEEFRDGIKDYEEEDIISKGNLEKINRLEADIKLMSEKHESLIQEYDDAKETIEAVEGALENRSKFLKSVQDIQSGIEKLQKAKAFVEKISEVFDKISQI